MKTEAHSSFDISRFTRLSVIISRILVFHLYHEKPATPAQRVKNSLSAGECSIKLKPRARLIKDRNIYSTTSFMQCRPCRFDDLDSPPRRALRLFSIANGTVRLVAVAPINKMDRNLVYSWIHSQEKQDGRETGIRSEETSFARMLYLHP